MHTWSSWKDEHHTPDGAIVLSSISVSRCHVLVFSIFYAIYLSLVKHEGTSLTSGRFVWNLVCSYLTRTTEGWIYCAHNPVVFLCVKRGRLNKMNSDADMKFQLVKVQCNFSEEVPKLRIWNLDAIQLQLEQEERNGFNSIPLAPSSLTSLPVSRRKQRSVNAHGRLRAARCSRLPTLHLSTTQG